MNQSPAVFYIMFFFTFLLQKKYRKGSVDISRIKCVEVVQNDGIIPCQNKYPFQVCFFGLYKIQCSFQHQ